MKDNNESDSLFSSSIGETAGFSSPQGALSPV